PKAAPISLFSFHASPRFPSREQTKHPESLVAITRSTARSPQVAYPLTHRGADVEVWEGHVEGADETDCGGDCNGWVKGGVEGGRRGRDEGDVEKVGEGGKVADVVEGV